MSTTTEGPDTADRWTKDEVTGALFTLAGAVVNGDHIPDAIAALRMINTEQLAEMLIAQLPDTTIVVCEPDPVLAGTQRAEWITRYFPNGISLGALDRMLAAISAAQNMPGHQQCEPLGVVYTLMYAMQQAAALGEL